MKKTEKIEEYCRPTGKKRWENIHIKQRIFRNMGNAWGKQSR